MDRAEQAKLLGTMEILDMRARAWGWADSSLAGPPEILSESTYTSGGGGCDVSLCEAGEGYQKHLPSSSSYIIISADLHAKIYLQSY